MINEGLFAPEEFDQLEWLVLLISESSTMRPSLDRFARGPSNVFEYISASHHQITNRTPRSV